MVSSWVLLVCACWDVKGYWTPCWWLTPRSLQSNRVGRIDDKSGQDFDGTKENIETVLQTVKCSVDALNTVFLVPNVDKECLHRWMGEHHQSQAVQTACCVLSGVWWCQSGLNWSSDLAWVSLQLLILGLSCPFMAKSWEVQSTILASKDLELK